MIDLCGRVLKVPSKSARASRSTSPAPSAVSAAKAPSSAVTAAITPQSDRPPPPAFATTSGPPPVPSTSSPAVASIPPVVSDTASTSAKSPISGSSLPISTTHPLLATGIAQDKLQPLTPSEIRKRTYDALKRRLGPDELDQLDWEKYTGTTAAKAEGDIQDLKTKLDGSLQRSKNMNKILQYINKYCAIVDVAIQPHPNITALVWAGARTIIQVCSELVLARSTHSSLARHEPL